MNNRLLAAATRLLTGVNVRWVNCQPNTRQRVYFANHTSNLDTLVLWAALPMDVRMLTRPAAARDYWEAGKLRRYLATKVFDAVLIERVRVNKHNNPVGVIMEVIGNRHSLILFPEGKRNPGPDVGEFKSGLYHISKNRPDLELVPVYIENLNRILPRGEFLPVRLLSSISFGTPIKASEGEGKAGFLRRARDAVCRLKP
ncbi:MAG TPA: lysophospholipid acyltransferase family protein [Candidatus Binatia bacterium]|nr:lysophospholipid acyltransferase family protein [Candidatus Binatia bacterium]